MDQVSRGDSFGPDIHSLKRESYSSVVSGGPARVRTYPPGGSMSELSDIIDALKPVSTATITTVLLKQGLRRVWMRGTRPIRPGQPRIVGRAFTLRFIPAREDLATPASWSSPRSTRGAIEEAPPGCVMVADAMGVTDAGIFGDILCARIKQRGVAGLVTDGVVRDMAGGSNTRPPLCGQPHLCQLAGADRVRRRQRLSRRSHSRGRRRRGADPGRAGRGRGPRRSGAGAPGDLDHG